MLGFNSLASTPLADDGAPASGGTSVTASPGAGTVTVTGYAPTVSASSNVTTSPGVGTVSVEGFAPTVSTAANITTEPGAGSVSVEGFAPTVSTAANITTEPGAGSVSVEGPRLSQQTRQYPHQQDRSLFSALSRPLARVAMLPFPPQLGLLRL